MRKKQTIRLSQDIKVVIKKGLSYKGSPQYSVVFYTRKWWWLFSYWSEPFGYRYLFEIDDFWEVCPESRRYQSQPLRNEYSCPYTQIEVWKPYSDFDLMKRIHEIHTKLLLNNVTAKSFLSEKLPSK